MIGDFLVGTSGSGYIAGSGIGILTVAGVPASREILLMSAKDLRVLRYSSSLESGHYIFRNLDIEKEYLVMARDNNKLFEPFAWDYVKPANDLTVAEQKELWLSWQV